MLSAMNKTLPTQKLWIRCSYSQYIEVKAETPEDALDLFRDDDDSIVRGGEVDHGYDIEEECEESQL